MLRLLSTTRAANRRAARWRANGSRALSSAVPSIVLQGDECVVMSMPVTPFQQNQSLVGCKKTGVAALFDAGGHPEPFISAAKELGMTIEQIFQTHAHIDHVAGLKRTKEELKDAPIFLHVDELPVYESVEQQARMFQTECDGPLPPVDKWLEDDGTISIGELTFRTFHTPGHSPGHIIFVSETTKQFIIGGDLIFNGSIGRTDLPGSDENAMKKSIQKLYALEGVQQDCLVFPGHGDAFTLSSQQTSNPFVQHWVG